jgi:hypothetical protein
MTTTAPEAPTDDSKTTSQPHWRIPTNLFTTLVGVGIVAAVIALAIWAANSHKLITAVSGRLPVYTFLALAALLTVFTLLIGWTITGSLGGALVDPKKGRYSLSRLQLISWTILILAGYLNAFIANIAAGRSHPITVAIPGQLLAAMGISIGGLVGTQLVLGYKKDNHNVITATDGNSVILGKNDSSSALVQASSTSIADIFKGDTAGGSRSLDLGKLQLFFVTVVLVLGYGIWVAAQFAHLRSGASGGVGSLPKIDQAFVALLALSHGGYLTTKAAA